MATKRIAHTVWEGNLLDGRGTVTFDSSGIGEAELTWDSRTEQPDERTSPEELIAAAHSSCYSMALSDVLTRAGTPPTTLHTRAEVAFQPTEGITGIHLTVRGEVSGVDAAAFSAAAADAKKHCPVSQALAGTTITLTATLD
ncbi:OsmC family peroxiredoxin [Streptantibioticus ferralitis]|uniref:OsmC family peroxiredoxin n=1 Tax=Streptantibioticus ferralitis TaxID=236510 RepID=A0ABT5Z3A1_9ACTN|nr:OsmC family peroxiredoxin [Streptantibioticus ferralitis]MDF2258273.1 OsmC family peroxiredoxin [Streptantibioticus ferralitis]